MLTQRATDRRSKPKVFKVRERKVVKLKDIAEVKIGLQSGTIASLNGTTAPGVRAVPTKGGYKKVRRGADRSRGGTRRR